MPDLGSEEQTAMQRLFEKFDLKEESVRPDGNCLYAAFASQLNYITSKKVIALPAWLKACSMITKR